MSLASRTASRKRSTVPLVARSPAAVERIADDRDRGLGAELAHHVLNRNGAGEALALELGGKIPEGQRGVLLALQCLLRQQRRRAVDECRLLPEIETRSQCERLEQEPALVEWAAGDRQFPAFEVWRCPDRRLRRHHHGAKRRGRRIEHELVAERTFARHPQPVRQHQVDRAALERDLAGFGRGQLHPLDIEVELPVEPVRAG